MPDIHINRSNTCGYCELPGHAAANCPDRRTVTPLSELDKARAALKPFGLLPGFVGALERFEAAVRANERSGTTTAATFRIAAVDLLDADLGPRPGHTDDYRAGWDDATHRAASYLNGRAQQAER